MKKTILLAAALSLFGFAIVGCNNDKPADTAPVTPPSSTGDKMGGDKMAAADPVVDKVNAAIMADVKLKDVKIDVTHKDGKVILKGSVADAAAKKEAVDTATKAAKDASPTDTVQSMLTTAKH